MSIKNRYQAFGTHLLFSAAVAAGSAALVFLVWYPWPLALAAGVIPIFLMLLGIDVVVGPAITFVVFDRKKKELKRDLLIVLVLQLAALLYGLHAVFIARPAYMVFATDRFELVYANELTDEKLKKVDDARFRSVPWTGPATVAVRRPDNATERSDIMLQALNGGDDVAQLPQFYVPYADQKNTVVTRLHELDRLRELNADAKDRVERALSRHGGANPPAGFLPVRGKVQDLTAIVDPSTGRVLEVVALRPWP